MNLPSLPQSENVLYLGLGGGYDVYGAIPIYEAHQRSGNVKNAAFANVSKEVTSMPPFKPFFALNPNGAVPLSESLYEVVHDCSIDTIMAVDGGVDCLMQGNEENAGTVLQDFITLAALNRLQRKYDSLKIVVACVGLGCEVEEQINNYAVLQNIARLTQAGGFYGSCSLVDGEDIWSYKTALATTTRKSHIQTRVLAAAEGRFGDLKLDTDANLSAITNLGFDPKPTYVTINPLMSIYWFFDFKILAQNNRVLPALYDTKTTTEALMAYRKVVTRTRMYQPFTL